MPESTSPPADTASPTSRSAATRRWTVKRVIAGARRRAQFRLTHGGPRSTFRRIHRDNYWKDSESVSGEGSSRKQTAVLVRELPGLLEQIGVQSLLDVPCGDFAWMRRVDRRGITYIGGDIVPELIEANRRDHATDDVDFRLLDLTVDDLPAADGILVRDCLVHLSTPLAWAAIEQVRRADIRWLLTTTYPDHHDNRDIPTGRWRALNLTDPPFSFPPPARALLEECTEHDGTRADKTLGVWRVSDLPSPPLRVRLDPRYLANSLRRITKR